MINLNIKFVRFLKIAIIIFAVSGCATARTNFYNLKETQKTDDGLINVYKSHDNLYFEIPDALFGRDMLLITRIAEAPENLSGEFKAGENLSSQMVRLKRINDKVLLKVVSPESSFVPDSMNISLSIQDNYFGPVIGAFNIVSTKPGSVVINVNNFFTKNSVGITPELKKEWDITGTDDNLSFINFVHSYPKNVEIRHTITFKSSNDAASVNGIFSIQVNQSLVLLPKELMTRRPFDRRIGYFHIELVDYGSQKLKADKVRFIERWKLIPSDTVAYLKGELVEPVKPIVFYVGRAVPERWRPFVKKGIEEWNKAFRSAGFKNAIIAKDAPTMKENPDWSPTDIRHSVVRWIATTSGGAEGHRIVDPRTGQVIKAYVSFNYDHLQMYRNRLIVELGAKDPDARTLSLPNDLIGKAIQQVIAHEVGHALGLYHNMIASSAYPVDSLRSPSFVKKYGISASIMDYARENYVAQPGDGVKQLIRKLGPYDYYAIEWGYRRFPNLTAGEREKRLDKMIDVHAGDPMYRFSWVSDNWVDPRVQTEDLGSNHIKASKLGIKNLKRVVPNLTEWTTAKTENYKALDDIYNTVLSMWKRYINDVVNMIGGIYVKRGDMMHKDRPAYSPVPREKQKKAVHFLAEYLFDPPKWLMSEEILSRVTKVGGRYWMKSLETSIFDNLLDPDRLLRMLRIEYRWPKRAYPISKFISDLQQNIWNELNSAHPKIGVNRRIVQRAYINQMVNLYQADEIEETDVPLIILNQLNKLESTIKSKIDDAANEITRIFLQHIVGQI